jgi:hypothetical protein
VRTGATPHMCRLAQGMQGMKVGGRRRLVVPPGLAYGDCGAGRAIAAGETLIVVCDLGLGLGITGASPAGNAVGRCCLALVA